MSFRIQIEKWKKEEDGGGYHVKDILLDGIKMPGGRPLLHSSQKQLLQLKKQEQRIQKQKKQKQKLEKKHKQKKQKPPIHSTTKITTTTAPSSTLIVGLTPPQQQLQQQLQELQDHHHHHQQQQQQQQRLNNSTHTNNMLFQSNKDDSIITTTTNTTSNDHHETYKRKLSSSSTSTSTSNSTTSSSSSYHLSSSVEQSKRLKPSSSSDGSTTTTTTTSTMQSSLQHKKSGGGCHHHHHHSSIVVMEDKDQQIKIRIKFLPSSKQQQQQQSTTPTQPLEPTCCSPKMESFNDCTTTTTTTTSCVEQQQQQYDDYYYMVKETSDETWGLEPYPQELSPLPMENEEFPNTGHCQWSIQDPIHRVILAKFSSSSILHPIDETYLYQLMERDDITLIIENCVNQPLNPKLWNFDFIGTSTPYEYYHKYRRFTKQPNNSLSSTGGQYTECDQFVSMKISDYVTYLKLQQQSSPSSSSSTGKETEFTFLNNHGQTQSIHIFNDVLYLIDCDMAKLLPTLDEDFKRNFKFPGILPGGTHCMMNKVNAGGRPFMGPNLYITPPASFTHFHQDGHGTVDSGHYCLNGYNEVVILRRLPELRKKHALYLLNRIERNIYQKPLTYDALYGLPHENERGERPPWPDMEAIEKCRKMNYCPSVFVLKPGQFVHINKGRLHAFRKLSPSVVLDPNDCHAEQRNQIISQNLRDEQYMCVSVAWDWMFKGFTSNGINREVSSIVECAALNRKNASQSLAIPETCLLQMAKTFLAEYEYETKNDKQQQQQQQQHPPSSCCSLFQMYPTNNPPCFQSTNHPTSSTYNSSRKVEPDAKTVLKGILPSLRSLVDKHVSCYSFADGMTESSSSSSSLITTTGKIKINSRPNTWENPEAFSLDPYGNSDFFCKLCSEELSNIYMHCDGCEEILNKDFNICLSCHSEGRYKKFIQMHPLNGLKHSTINHTGHYHLDRQSRCPCKRGPICKKCSYCAGCSCRCHKNFTLYFRFMGINDENELLTRVSEIVDFETTTTTTSPPDKQQQQQQQPTLPRENSQNKRNKYNDHNNHQSGYPTTTTTTHSIDHMHCDNRIHIFHTALDCDESSTSNDNNDDDHYDDKNESKQPKNCNEIASLEEVHESTHKSIMDQKSSSCINNDDKMKEPTLDKKISSRENTSFAIHTSKNDVESTSDNRINQVDSKTLVPLDMEVLQEEKLEPNLKTDNQSNDNVSTSQIICHQYPPLINNNINPRNDLKPIVTDRTTVCTPGLIAPLASTLNLINRQSMDDNIHHHQSAIKEQYSDSINPHDNLLEKHKKESNDERDRRVRNIVVLHSEINGSEEEEEERPESNKTYIYSNSNATNSIRHKLVDRNQPFHMNNRMELNSKVSAEAMQPTNRNQSIDPLNPTINSILPSMQDSSNNIQSNNGKEENLKTLYYEMNNDTHKSNIERETKDPFQTSKARYGKIKHVYNPTAWLKYYNHELGSKISIEGKTLSAREIYHFIKKSNQIETAHPLFLNTTYNDTCGKPPSDYNIIRHLYKNFSETRIPPEELDGGLLKFSTSEYNILVYESKVRPTGMNFLPYRVKINSVLDMIRKKTFDEDFIKYVKRSVEDEYKTEIVNESCSLSPPADHRKKSNGDDTHVSYDDFEKRTIGSKVSELIIAKEGGTHVDTIKSNM